MVNIKLLDRDAPNKEDRGQLPSRNLDPRLHPFERGRELKRAVNAAKLRKIFAKPLIAQLEEGDLDTPLWMDLGHNRLNDLVSGNADGTISFYDLHTRGRLGGFQAHHGPCRVVAVGPDDRSVYSSGDDGKIQQWRVSQPDDSLTVWDVGAIKGKQGKQGTPSPLVTYSTVGPCRGLDFQWQSERFCAAANEIEIFDVHRIDPMSKLNWGLSTNDGYTCAAFNPTETDIIAAAGSDYDIVLADLREKSPAARVDMRMKTNCLSWNPHRPRHLATGGDDGKVHIWDLRKFKEPVSIRVGHVRAVLCLDYSPTGQNLVSGGHDSQVKIWEADGQFTPIDNYATKRMQEVHSVRYSRDSKHVFSGSADFAIRHWRARADERVSAVQTQEKRAIRYRDTLVEKWKHMPEMKNILRPKKAAKYIRTLQKQIANERDKDQRKEDRRSKHSKKTE